jgi:hypothetical protein
MAGLSLKNPGVIPVQSMWNLRWTNWHCDTFLTNHFGFLQAKTAHRLHYRLEDWRIVRSALFWDITCRCVATVYQHIPEGCRSHQHHGASLKWKTAVQLASSTAIYRRDFSFLHDVQMALAHTQCIRAVNQLRCDANHSSSSCAKVKN